MFHLAQYTGSVNVKISIHNLKGRKLQVISPSRFPLSFDYKATTNDLTLIDQTFTTVDINDNKLEIAKKAAIKLFRYFGNFEPSEKVIEEDQKKLLERRL